MLEKLKKVEEKFDFISAELCKSEVVSDMELYKKYMQELKHLSPIVEKYREYKAAEKNAGEAKGLLEESGADPELKELARAELEEAKENIERTQQELKVLLLPRDPNDDRNVIVEIRGGAGGEEAALFAGVLFRMYSMYGDTKGFKTEVLSANATELGGYKEISFMISGEGAYSRLKFESGVHRVQRVPETETQGRIHTSTVTVTVMPEAEEVELEINPKDLRIDTFRSSGAGGQHINKTSSAIRVTHLPTGMVVECQDQRSQRENKERALKVLRSRLLQQKQDAYDEEYNARRQSQVGSGDRSEKIRTYNFPQDRVTDHRIGLTLRNLQGVLDGDLDRVVEPLILADREEKLKQSSTEEGK